MEQPKKRRVLRFTRDPRPGAIAQAKGQTLNSFRVAALPIVNRILQRMRLDEFLHAYLSRADRRCRIAPAIGVTLLLKNVLLCREPLYGVGEWAARYAPELLGLVDTQLPSLNDDRVGRCLDRLFQCDVSSLVLELVTHVVREFQVELDELHNDSTTVTLHGDYENAAREEPRGWRRSSSRPRRRCAGPRTDGSARWPRSAWSPRSSSSSPARRRPIPTPPGKSCAAAWNRA